jgi:CBS-domain-containing membrane protein
MTNTLPRRKKHLIHTPRQKRQLILRRLFRKYLSKIHGSRIHQPKFSFKQILFSFLGSLFGIGTLAYITATSNHPFIAAPLGATAVLVFGVPESPLAQPRNVIGGNFLGALVSVFLVHLFGPQPWVMALAVAIAIKLMQLTKTVHPPAGAVALLGVLTQADWNYVLTPILAGSITIVLCTFFFHNMVPGKNYPLHWL